MRGAGGAVVGTVGIARDVWSGSGPRRSGPSWRRGWRARSGWSRWGGWPAAWRTTSTSTLTVILGCGGRAAPAASLATAAAGRGGRPRAGRLALARDDPAAPRLLAPAAGRPAPGGARRGGARDALRAGGGGGRWSRARLVALEGADSIRASSTSSWSTWPPTRATPCTTAGACASPRRRTDPQPGDAPAAGEFVRLRISDRQWHVGRRALPRLRAVLHHQGAGQGYRALARAPAYGVVGQAGGSRLGGERAGRAPPSVAAAPVALAEARVRPPSSAGRRRRRDDGPAGGGRDDGAARGQGHARRHGHQAMAFHAPHG